MKEESSERKRRGHHKHSKHHSKKRSKHSHSKHKHKHHHHHHKKRHKYHSKTEAVLDENLIQNALESIEVDVLEAMRVPETLDQLMETASQSDTLDDDSEDSDRSSLDEGETGSSSKQVASKIVLPGPSKTWGSDSGTASSGTADSGAVLERENQDRNNSVTVAETSHKKDSLSQPADLPGSKNRPSDSKASLKGKDKEAGSDDGSGSEEESVGFMAAGTLKQNNKKVFKINIKLQLGESDSNKSTPNEDCISESSNNDSAKGESKKESKEELNSPNTVTVVSNGTKVTYINLKPSTTESNKTASKPPASEQDEVQDSDVFRTVTSKAQAEPLDNVDAASVKEKSDEESSQRKQSHSRSRSRSRSRTPRSKNSRRSKRSRSKSRRKSGHNRSRSRPRSRSRRRRTHRSRSRSHSDSHSPVSHRHGKHSSYRSGRYRSRSRSHSRSRRGDRSRSHSHSRYSARRSSKYDSRRRYSPSRRYHSRRSRSRTPRPRRRSFRSRSRSRTRTPSSKGTPTPPPADPKEVAKSISVIASGIMSRAKHDRISELTAFCEDLQKRQAVEDEFGPQSDEEAKKEDESSFRTPFNVKPTPVYEPGLVFHNNTWKTANQVMMETSTVAVQRPLEEKFPVSAGVEHKRVKDEEEGGAQEASDPINIFANFQPVSVGDLVVKRLEATRQLQLNPNDSTAQQTLAYIEQQTSVWAESQLKPGQFTGQQKITPLTKDLHKEGRQAWARKDMFRDLAPVMSGFGMKMLKKMGWEEGKPLGKMGEGHVEPISMDVKLNRSGLSTELDKKQPAIVPASALQATGKANHLVEGKNPISALQEICAKKRWVTPQYELVLSGGPAHMKCFLFQVTIPVGTFQPATASNNKKQAKAQAAIAALQGLGFMPKTIEYSASFS